MNNFSNKSNQTPTTVLLSNQVTANNKLLTTVQKAAMASWM